MTKRTGENLLKKTHNKRQASPPPLQRQKMRHSTSSVTLGKGGKGGPESDQAKAKDPLMDRKKAGKTTSVTTESVRSFTVTVIQAIKWNFCATVGAGHGRTKQTVL